MIQLNFLFITANLSENIKGMNMAKNTYTIKYKDDMHQEEIVTFPNPVSKDEILFHKDTLWKVELVQHSTDSSTLFIKPILD